MEKTQLCKKTTQYSEKQGIQHQLMPTHQMYDIKICNREKRTGF